MTTLHSIKDIEVARGLKGVVSHATQLSEVDGQAGRLVVRGYDIHELVGRVTFEEAAYLLWHGELPNRQQLDVSQQEMAAARHLPGPIMDVLRAAARQATGMHALRLGAAGLCLDEPDADDLSPHSNRRLALRITARMPALVAHHYRLRQGESICVPPDHLGFAAAYLYMLEGREPAPARVDGLNAYLVAVLEHGMNASTFVARAIASSDSDIMSAITGAVGSLKGQRHGGVPGPVLEMLTAIGTPDRAETWVRAALGRGERIMGFGHRIYKVRDPRAEVLVEAAERLARLTGDRKLLDLTAAVERVTVKVLEEAKPGRDLYANVELYAALILHAVRIPSELFTPTFAISRTAGWTAHVVEQFADNLLIRPESVYVGPRGRTFVPVDQR
ncbi:MAG TPA: citrate/2-methylcitrate synthase [Candidatus Tectomicrobia bacterium]|nr:citrate/2-methylcitrate synthase [Candidatus Tectomicrobia bacterium]